MSTITESAVLEALRSVKDPDLHRDIVELGFVKDIKICGGNIAFTIELTTPACPVKKMMEDEAKISVMKIPGVDTVNINMTAQVRATFQNKELLKNVKNLIAVGSGKGGVGKSTVASAIAVALAKEGAKVGLMDLDVWGPNIPLMMGIKSTVKVLDGKILPIEKYGVKVMSIGFFLKDNEPVIWRGPMVHGLIRQFAQDVIWGDLDYMICDLPPGTGDVQISLCQSIPPTGAVIVSTPQDVALLDASKAIAMFRKVNTPILGIIENMSYYECPKCSNRAELFGYGGAETAAKSSGVPFLGRIPIDVDIRIGGDSGEPISIKKPNSIASETLLGVARNLAAQISIANIEKRNEPVIDIPVSWGGSK